jgi:bifunctional DNase/RNase
LLKEKFGERSLPIWIGENEAFAIVLSLEGKKPPRPLTHDLLKLVIDALQSRVLKVEVVELKMLGESGTYYAKLYLEVDSKIIAIDARPSDSIALALRTSSTIFVDASVMEENGRILEGDTNVDEMKRRLRNTKPEQFGDFNLKK